jgi:hypothetical protein
MNNLILNIYFIDYREWILIVLPSSCTHPPGPLLLQAKEGGVKNFAPLCEAERGWGEFMGLYN